MPAYRELCLQIINDKNDRDASKLAGFVLSGKEPFTEFLKILQTITTIDVSNNHIDVYFNHFGVQKMEKFLKNPNNVVLYLIFKRAKQIYFKPNLNHEFGRILACFKKCQNLEKVTLDGTFNSVKLQRLKRYQLKIENSAIRPDFVKLINFLSPFLTNATKSNMLDATGFVTKDSGKMTFHIENASDLDAFLCLENIELDELIVELCSNLLSQFYLSRTLFKNIRKFTLNSGIVAKSVDECAEIIQQVVAHVKHVFPSVQEITLYPGTLTFTKMLFRDPDNFKIEPSLAQIQRPVTELLQVFQNYQNDCKTVVNVAVEYKIITGNDDGLFERHIMALSDTGSAAGRYLDENLQAFSFEKKFKGRTAMS